MTTPQIRIQSSMLLFNSVSESERQRWADGISQPLMKFEEVESYTKQLQTAWGKYESSVLEKITSLYGVSFKKPIIDIYVSPWNKSISNPFILNPSRPPEIQIETLIHELLHVLFTDNTAFSMHDPAYNIKLVDKWRELFGSELEWKTLVHIPVYAGLKAVFLDTFNEPERLERELGRHHDNPAYKKAWEYVETRDYLEINNQLADIYSQISTQ